MFFKIGALKNFAKKTSCNLLALIQVFYCQDCKVFKNSFFIKHFNRFLEKCPCYYVLIIFTSQHVLETHRLFINFSSIIRFSKWIHQIEPFKAQRWHALSHEQFFLKNCWTSSLKKLQSGRDILEPYSVLVQAHFATIETKLDI